MLRVQSVSKTYGAEKVLDGVSFVLSPGDRAGLIGPNGSGKSTLLRLIAGEVTPDAGSVWLDPGHSAAYLPQYPFDELSLTVREALRRGAFLPVGEAQQRLELLEQAMSTASGEPLESLLRQYAQARETFEHLGGYALEARMDEVVAGLSLDVRDLDTPVGNLSGGNKTKLSLARLLLSGADVLLLDEPTNYLDLPAMLWLERFVVSGGRSFVIVSHDRRFLDRTVSEILELDRTTHRLRRWAGSYSDYAEAKLREEQKLLEAYRDQQTEIQRIEEDIRRTKEQARGVEARTKSGMGADVQRRYAKKVAKKAKARERRLEKQLEGGDLIEKPKPNWGLHLVDLGTNPIEDQRVIVDAQNLHAGYDGREILHGANLLLRGRDRVALLGENGSGKTTLLRCIAGSIPFDGTLAIGPSVRMGVLSQEAEELPSESTVLQVFRSRTVMREDEARTYLHKFLFSGDEVFKPVGELSYGQRAKLALAILILSGANFLILDEPTSHLDLPAVEAIERSLSGFRGPLLVVSHDRYFLERIRITRFEVLSEGRLRPVASLEVYESAVRQGQ